jgi:hypothetical protein
MMAMPSTMEVVACMPLVLTNLLDYFHCWLGLISHQLPFALGRCIDASCLVLLLEVVLN